MTRSSFKAILVKDIRENLHWAAVACLIALGLLVFALYKEFDLGMSINGYLFARTYMVVCPIAGLVLGLVQMAPDMRRGRRQFLIHRPISAGSLLVGKILAGFVLYFLSVGLPLGLVIVWVATPGHIPGPFSSNMIGPEVDKFFAGFPWYAAGLLVAARSGRWVGSRLIPIGGAVAAILFCNIIPRTDIDSIGASIIFTALILTAARSAYITGGEMTRSSAWAKASLAFTLIAGWAFLIVILMLFARGAAGPTSWSSPQPGSPFQRGPRESIGLDNGLWLNIWPGWNHSGLTITDRQSLSESLDGGRRNVSTVQTGTLSPALDNPALFVPGLKLRTGIDSPKMTRLFNSWNSNWFYVWQRQTVEGYDRNTCKYLGSLSPSGFLGPSASPQPFQEPMLSLTEDYGLFQWPDVIYRLTFSPPAVQTVFTAAPGDPIISAGLLWYQSGETMDELDRPDRDIAVRTREQVHVLHGAHEVMTLPIDGKSDRSDIAVAITDSGRFILAFLSQDRGQTTVVENIFFYNADSILEHQTRNYDVVPLTENIIVSHTDWLEICGFTAFSPLPLIDVVQSHQLHGEAAPWWVIMICLISLLSGAVFAFVAASLIRAHHAARLESYLWITLCAVLGLPAILALISMYDRPRSTRCHACGKRRLLTESVCPHCGARAASPEMRGIEILEPAVVIN